MPIFNKTVNPVIKKDAATGQSYVEPPSRTLINEGPKIQVTISVPASIEQQLIAAGSVIPQPISGEALIDTGAFRTSIDQDVAVQLGLPVIDQANISSATHSNITLNVYPPKIEFHGLGSIQSARAIGCNLQSQGIIAILGRDILAGCTLFYNGTTGSYTISF